MVADTFKEYWWGFDPFMNLVVDECVEMAINGQGNNIRMVVTQGN